MKKILFIFFISAFVFSSETANAAGPNIVKADTNSVVIKFGGSMSRRNEFLRGSYILAQQHCGRMNKISINYDFDPGFINARHSFYCFALNELENYFQAKNIK